MVRRPFRDRVRYFCNIQPHDISKGCDKGIKNVQLNTSGGRYYKLANSKRESEIMDHNSRRANTAFQVMQKCLIRNLNTWKEIEQRHFFWSLFPHLFPMKFENHDRVVLTQPTSQMSPWWTFYLLYSSAPFEAYFSFKSAPIEIIRLLSLTNTLLLISLTSRHSHKIKFFVLWTNFTGQGSDALCATASQ